MAIGSKKIGKLSGLTMVFLAWSAGVFWVGWKSPELFGEPFTAFEPAPKVAQFYPLEKFIFSVPGKDTSHYLLLEMALKSRSDDAANIIRDADPLIKNALMKMFSQKEYEELHASHQLELLQTEAQVLLATVLNENNFSIELDDVLFTRMVIQ
ncbi:flagellar basal body protein FliL [Shewanella sp. UCD-FRSSP16_17]|uniref:flagellar basal body-associated FliL family protein n=1 Tax=Shewanella sp. UCD-FRSSP16_17 TaxID=1853256 RepID=UPI0007EED632|nr:flagellar basal body-associated FliL family protein [Shewanella sp. UCD-FRSSP16_17]OBT05333.1 flagellar basal body protein FliL [Shewanella sp. UCD-FRSSP16_17]